MELKLYFTYLNTSTIWYRLELVFAIVSLCTFLSFDIIHQKQNGQRICDFFGPRNNDHSSRKKIHLAPSDLTLLYLDYMQRGLLFPKTDQETSCISRLKSSLASALEIYFPLAGRLVKENNHEDNTVSFYIDCNDGFGAKFIHAIAESVSVSDLLQPHGSVPKLFFPMNGVKNIDGISEPLLALQVTEIKDGIFISFGYNHLVADGSSIWKFFHDWSKICLTGQRDDLQPLHLIGWFLDEIDYPIHIPLSEIDTKTETETETETSMTKERVFHFTKKTISYLKAKANEEIGFVDIKISSLQAVLAHLWRSIAKHSGLNREEKTYCKVAADLRQRLEPPIRKEYFGNLVNVGMATATVGDLVDHGLGWASLQISEIVRSQTNENFKNSAEDWVRNVKIPKINVRSKMGDHSLMVASSPWFQVYDNDFGLGKPIAVRAGPGNGIGGKLVVFRGIEDGSIDVHAMLSLSLWSEVLVNVLDDIENVTTT